MEIKRTNSGDADFLSLVKLLDRELAEIDGDEHAFFAQFNKLDTSQHSVVAYMDGEPAGSGAFKEYEPGVAEIKRMYVKPEFRGKGISKNVLSALEAWAAELGYHTCILETGVRQPVAISLYQKAGYTSIPNYGQYEGLESSVSFKKEF